ncbi:MAG: alpha/beta family hydrolase [Gammaproteobacteria bacterium]
MHIERRKIGIDEDLEVSLEWALPERFGACPGLILTHGAGNHMPQRMLSHVHQALADRGILTVKFNLQRSGPQSTGSTAAAETSLQGGDRPGRIRHELNPSVLFLGGKSLGGRIASELVASGQSAAGLVFLGYPLHPAGRPERLRTGRESHARCCSSRLARPFYHTV